MCKWSYCSSNYLAGHYNKIYYEEKETWYIAANLSLWYIEADPEIPSFNIAEI